MKKKNEQELEMLKEVILSLENSEGTDNKSSQTDAQSKEDALPTKEAQFEKLIKGEFKEQFEERIQNNLKRRFKESSELKAKNELNEQIVEMLMAKYAIDKDDKESLIKAIQSDDGLIKEKTEKTDVEADALERIKQLELENQSMKENYEKEKQAQLMEKTIAQWMKDGEFLKENYPEFDLEAESENPAFLKLLKGGADLKGAYLAMHHNEIIEALVEKAAREAKEEALKSLRARDMRPAENGTSAKSAALFKTDVSKLTPKQRAEIARRVSEGEKISF